MNLSFLKKAVCAFAASALALSLPAQLPAAAAAPDAWAITADMGAGWNLGNTLECTYRADDSANNRSRLLMIPSYHATDNYEALSNLAIPSNAGNLAISVHAYEPYSFTMDTSESHIYESNNQYGGYIPTLLSNVMNDLKKIQSEKGVPIIIGEFGASDFNNSSERIKWARDYMSQASAAGFPCILWDNNVTTSWGDSFGVFNRNSCTLNSGAYDYVNAIISGARSSSGGTSDSGSTGSDDTSLSAWSALTLFTDNTYADGKHDIVISCTAETAPQLVLERIGDYSWNARIEASSVSDGKAYYTADSIAAALSANGMNQSSVSKICMLTVCSTAYYGVTAQEVVTEQPSDDTDYSWHMIFGSDGAACLNAWNSTTVSWDTSLLDGSYDFAVIYSGSSAPVFVAENAYDYSWNVNVNADSRSSTGIAYYSADDIAAKFSQYGVSRWDMGRLILMASDYTEIYGVYVFAA